MKNCLNTLLIGFLALWSCNTTPEKLRASDYVKWVSSGEREFNKVKEVNKIKIAVRYMPAEYLAYQEYRSSNSENYDSVKRSYECGLTFQIFLQADKTDKIYGNLLQYGVFSQEELTARVKFLGFGIEEFIYGEYNGEVVTPVLTHYEGFDAIGNKLSFQVVFMIPEYKCGKATSFDALQISFDDPIWNTGKNNFHFSGSSLLTTPDLIF